MGSTVREPSRPRGTSIWPAGKLARRSFSGRFSDRLERRTCRHPCRPCHRHPRRPCHPPCHPCHLPSLPCHHPCRHPCHPCHHPFLPSFRPFPCHRRRRRELAQPSLPRGRPFGRDS